MAIFGLGWPRKSDLRLLGQPKPRSLSKFWLLSKPRKILPSMIFWHSCCWSKINATVVKIGQFLNRYTYEFNFYAKMLLQRCSFQKYNTLLRITNFDTFWEFVQCVEEHFNAANSFKPWKKNFLAECLKCESMSRPTDHLSSQLEVEHNKHLIWLSIMIVKWTLFID